MPEAKQNSGQSHRLELLHLYDEFVEFDAYCAFFCEAVSALSSNREEWLDETSVLGLCYFSDWMKKRSKNLKGKLKSVQLAAWEKESS